MGDTSSDDELPLAQRPLGGILLAGRATAAAAAAADSSDSDSDIPSWLQAAGGKAKGHQVINLTDSSDGDAVLSPAKPPAPAPAAAAVEPAGNRGSQQAPASQQQQQAAAGPKSAAKPQATPGRGRAAAAAAAAAAVPDDQPSTTQPSATQPSATQPSATQPSGTQAGGTAQKRAGALPGVVGLPHVPTSSMPVVLPEKLPQMKMLVELECSADDTHGVTDLSGDSGAIGRLTMGGTKAEPQMQVDLKGVLYNATIVPCPVSLAVINMGQAEAKVECLFSEFVQLREDTRFSFVDTNQLGGLVGDDDENYASPGGEGGGDEGGGALKKGRGKAAAGGGKAAGGKGGASAAPRKRAAPKAKGGVKKGAGKPRAKPKPKAAAGKKKK